MAKRGERSPGSTEARLRKRLAIRTLEIWKESGYSDKLAPYGIRAIEYLKSIKYDKLD